MVTSFGDLSSVLNDIDTYETLASMGSARWYRNLNAKKIWGSGPELFGSARCHSHPFADLVALITEVRQLVANDGNVQGQT